MTPVGVGAIVPHAPVLIPEVCGGRLAGETQNIAAALRKLSFEDADVVVLLSPHGAGTGVYAGVSGSLAPAGMPSIGVTRPTDARMAALLADAWGVPLLDGAVDDGVWVPLALVDVSVPVVAATLRGITGPGAGDHERCLDEAARFAQALTAIAAGARIGFVASAEGSAGLSPRAPLTELPGARRVEERLLSTVRDDVAGLLEIADDLHVVAGSCGVGPLAALGRLFAGSAADVAAHGAPFGVGYLVATVTR